jgi:hypothetical protein
VLGRKNDAEAPWALRSAPRRPRGGQNVAYAEHVPKRTRAPKGGTFVPMLLPRPPLRRDLILLMLAAVVGLVHLLLPMALPWRDWAPASRSPHRASPPTLQTRSVQVPPSTILPRQEPPQPRSAQAPAPRALQKGRASPAAAAAASVPAMPSAPAAATEAVAQTPALAPQDGQGSLQYVVSGQFAGRRLGGSASLEWSLGAAGYTARLNITGSSGFSALFAWRLESTGSIGTSGPAPQRYDEELLTVGADSQRRSVNFVTDKIDAAGDPLSTLLQMAARLRPGLPLPMQITVWYAGAPQVLTLMFEGEETLETPHGAFATAKYILMPAQAGEQAESLTLWLDPERRNAPVRVQLERLESAIVTLDLVSDPVPLPAGW